MEQFDKFKRLDENTKAYLKHVLESALDDAFDDTSTRFQNTAHQALYEAERAFFRGRYAALVKE